MHQNSISSALDQCAVVQSPEARCYCTSLQMAIEHVHAETYYSLLIATLIPVMSEQTPLFQTIDALPCVCHKANWAIHWCYTTSYICSERLIVFRG
jgi:ribonucleoside-diphosphate reductase beta chain